MAIIKDKVVEYATLIKIIDGSASIKIEINSGKY